MAICGVWEVEFWACRLYERGRQGRQQLTGWAHLSRLPQYAKELARPLARGRGSLVAFFTSTHKQKYKWFVLG